MATYILNEQQYKDYVQYLIDEQVESAKIENQIKTRRRYHMRYTSDDTEKIQSGWRKVDVYQYGRTMQGNPCIRAFETPESDTFSDHKPRWRLFKIQNIDSFSPTLYINKRPQPGFNTTGDNGMSEVYMIADYGQGTNTPSSPQSQPAAQSVKVDKQNAPTDDLSNQTDTEKQMAQVQQKQQPAQQQKQPNKPTQQPTTQPDNGDNEFDDVEMDDAPNNEFDDIEMENPEQQNGQTQETDQLKNFNRLTQPLKPQ